MQTKIGWGRRTIIKVPIECERPAGRLTAYGFRLPQTPAPQERLLDKSKEDRRLARDHLARIVDQNQPEGCPQVRRLTWTRPQLPDEAGQVR